MLLIITGCIIVDKGMPYVNLRDKETRLADYIKTIRWAIDETAFNDIIFCDNSNYDFGINDEFKQLIDKSIEAAKNLELYSFQGDVAAINERGKGYGEGEILKYIYNHSKLMKEYGYFYKITGRLTINNINKVVLSEKKENIFIFDVRREEIDTRFYKMKTEDYQKNFMEIYKKTNDMAGVYLEHLYYPILYMNRIPFCRFNRSLEFRGISGTTGNCYDYHFKENKITEMIYQSFLYKTYFGRKILRRISKLVIKS